MTSQGDCKVPKWGLTWAYFKGSVLAKIKLIIIWSFHDCTLLCFVCCSPLSQPSSATAFCCVCVKKLFGQLSVCDMGNWSLQNAMNLMCTDNVENIFLSMLCPTSHQLMAILYCHVLIVSGNTLLETHFLIAMGVIGNATVATCVFSLW